MAHFSQQSPRVRDADADTPRSGVALVGSAYAATLPNAVIGILGDVAPCISQKLDEQQMRRQPKGLNVLELQREVQQLVAQAPRNEWRCLHCQLTNWDDRSCCNRCGQLRSDIDLQHKLQCLRERAKRRLQEGSAGGFNDRQTVQKEAWNSDDEDLDEFGRKKKKTRRERGAAGDSEENRAVTKDKQAAALARLRLRSSQGRAGAT
eukprot:TRINITY_DN45978_c0_g1_i1.p1 TRINITY_DN45978_c0_g1~~TRINITY_DN45978_c0_g1_i1.p1  ORF type:complete len:206 (-),score=30.26 TRINITY_DN45978_c0_g1_i1:88-705(-)